MLLEIIFIYMIESIILYIFYKNFHVIIKLIVKRVNKECDQGNWSMDKVAWLSQFPRKMQ